MFAILLFRLFPSEGSVIASFTLNFTALDSFQALFLMDAIDNDYYLGKLPIVRNKTTSFSSPTGRYPKRDVYFHQFVVEFFLFIIVTHIGLITYGMSFLVPSSPPSNVTAVSNDATSIDVSWNEVPTPDQNGVITGYLVFYRESSAKTYTIAATMQLKLKIQGLSAATSFSLRVLAYNSNGNGIASELITLTTREKGSIINDSDDFVTSYSFAYRNLSFSFWPPLLKYHMKQKPKCRQAG